MKIIIGVMSGSSDKIKKYEDDGYAVTSIQEHVLAFAKTLIANREFNDEELQKVRNSGYKNSKSFWVNLSLLACKNNDRILITDLHESDDKRVFAKVL